MNELDTKYMKEAIKQAKKALKSRLAVSLSIRTKLLRAGTTAEIPTRPHSDMQKLPQSKKPAALSATGGWKTVRFILH